MSSRLGRDGGGGRGGLEDKMKGGRSREQSGRSEIEGE